MSRKLMYPIIVLALAFGLNACVDHKSNTKGELPGYAMKKIEAELILPDSLNEISGLTDIDNNTVACIQDENGILFIYDIIRNKTIRQINFDFDGDYEELASIGSTMYVLRSDGALVEILNYNHPDMSMSIYLTGIPVEENEGLCCDSANNRLLIAGKCRPEDETDVKNLRVIYAFDLSTHKLSDEPVYTLNTAQVKKFALKQKIKLPTEDKTKKNKIVHEPIINLKISAIAIHPVTSEIYILSAVDFLLLVFDKSGNILHIEKLDKNLFKQAEGITFLKNGDMLITNEGQLGKPNLLRFNYSLNQYSMQ
jgi:uncharacterized protein YjiK